MKNLSVYYLAILLPFPLLILSLQQGHATLFAMLLLGYDVYRGFIDGQAGTSKSYILKIDKPYLKPKVCPVRALAPKSRLGNLKPFSAAL
jgi:hypothetical protein